MLRLVRPMIVATLCGFVLVAGSVRGAEPGENAALAYWQAFALLPTLNEEQDKLLADVSKVKLDQRTRELVNTSANALTCMRRAASLPACDWGLDFAAGPHMVMPHLAKARQMARYACLHARQQLADGQADKALETIRDTLILARHAGADDVIISVLVQHALEQLVIDTACHELHKLDVKQLDTLTRYLDSSPKGGSLRASLQREQEVYVGWAQRAVKEAKNDGEAVESLRGAIAPPDQAPKVAGVTRKQIADWLDGTNKDYDEIQAIFDLPDEQFQPRWDALEKRIRGANPYSSMVLPALKNVREASRRNTVTWALFRAAIAVQRDGMERLASIKDPAGKGPFQYQKLPAGFRLTSQFVFRGKPVELTVGSGAE